jgi:hypothetical protein
MRQNHASCLLINTTSLSKSNMSLSMLGMMIVVRCILHRACRASFDKNGISFAPEAPALVRVVQAK